MKIQFLLFLRDALMTHCRLLWIVSVLCGNRNKSWSTSKLS